MGLFDGIAGAAGGILGGIIGGQGNQSSQSTVSGVQLAPESALENRITNTSVNDFNAFRNMVRAGAGTQDVSAAATSQRSLADMLQQFSQGGFMPTQQDFQTANNFAAQAFQPRQVALDQSLEDTRIQAERLAARLGRPVNDPIIQAKLGQERVRQQQSLSAEQSAFGAQFAQNLPMQRLGFAGQLADVRNNLAAQAMSNRQALLSLGNSLQSSERNWRLGTATRFSNQNTQSGGGLGGMLSGAIAGVGQGMAAAPGLASVFGNLFTSRPASTPPIAMNTTGGFGSRFTA